MAEACERKGADIETEELQHFDAVYGVALKLTRAPGDAEDLVSDTILRAFERWHQFRSGTNSRSWLFTILYHAFVSRRRRRTISREVPAADRDDGRPLL